MTATDELRRMLDERRVEWDKGAFPNEARTYWQGVVARPWDEQRIYVTALLTPEQAIAATLGRGTCKVTNECKCSACGWQYPCSNYRTYTTCDGYTAYRPSWRYYNDCGRVNFCPNCGRKVVDNG